MNMKAVGICALVSFIIALIISFGTSIALIFFFAPMNLVDNNANEVEIDMLSFFSFLILHSCNLLDD